MSAKFNDAFRIHLIGASPPWLIDTFDLTDTHLTFAGWAIPPSADPDAVTFLLDGGAIESVQYGLPSPSLLGPFYYLKNAGYSYFLCKHPRQPLEKRPHAEIAFANRYTRWPFNPWHNTYIPLQGIDKIAIPEKERLMRTQGNDSQKRYINHGLTTYHKLRKLAWKYFRKDINGTGSLLDWGCGCGRVIQHFVHQGSKMKLHGTDIDADNIEWCKKHIPNATFTVAPLHPPTAYPDNHFDLIFGISVLTHLDENTQFAWLQELQRIAKPGAAVLLTVHGEYALARVGNDDVIGKTLEHGHNADSPDRNLDGFIAEKDYYRATYHASRYVQEEFARYFDVLDILPGANASIQDFVVLTKKG